jgi:hypothetical protein
LRSVGSSLGRHQLGRRGSLYTLYGVQYPL